MSFSHLLILGIIAVIVIPPDKLPEVARQFAKFLGDMRRMTAGIFDDLKQDNILKPEDMFKNKNQPNVSFPPPVAPASTVTPTSSAGDLSVAPSVSAPTIESPSPEEALAATEAAYQKHIQGETIADAIEPAVVGDIASEKKTTS